MTSKIFSFRSIESFTFHHVTIESEFFCYFARLVAKKGSNAVRMSADLIRKYAIFISSCEYSINSVLCVTHFQASI